jgi:hypothetical protein
MGKAQGAARRRLSEGAGRWRPVPGSKNSPRPQSSGVATRWDARSERGGLLHELREELAKNGGRENTGPCCVHTAWIGLAAGPQTRRSRFPTPLFRAAGGTPGQNQSPGRFPCFRTVVYKLLTYLWLSQSDDTPNHAPASAGPSTTTAWRLQTLWTAPTAGVRKSCTTPASSADTTGGARLLSRTTSTWRR